MILWLEMSFEVSNIFPELINLNNIKRLDKILNYTDLNLETLLSILLIDGKDNHEYFAHKYNISNKTRENLKLLAMIPCDILLVIPARGGSKGIPRKNLRLLNGKPLIYYAIK